MTNTENNLPGGTPVLRPMYDLDLEIENLKPKTEKEIYLSYKPSSARGYAVDSVTYEMIEVKDLQPVDVGIEGDFYSHLPLKGTGFVISEGQSAVMLSSGPTIEAALFSAKQKIKSFISKKSEEDFYGLLNAQKRKLKAPNFRYGIVKHIIQDIPPPVTEVITEKTDDTEEAEEMNLNIAISQSLNFMNCIDLDYIATLLKEDPDVIRDQILDQELGYENPETYILEAPDEYLSGNVREKLEIARKMSVGNSMYEKNIEQLSKIIPEDIPASLIQYTIGAAWIPLHVFEQFAFSMFKTKVDVLYLASNGKFSAKTRIGFKTIQITSTYAAGTKNGLDIFNATLNCQQIIVNETVMEDGKTKQVKSVEHTSAAQSMQEQMQDEFQSFIMSSKEIQDETEKIYNNVYNGFIDRKFRVPDFHHYPGASKHIKLRAHQKVGVLRGLKESTLFAHQVGSGKSYLIMTTAMEMRRLGIANKPMIAVQNKTRGQFITAFMGLYPNAKILAPSQEELSTANKPFLMQRIANEDWDAIVIPHSQIDLIPDDLGRQRALIESSIKESEETLCTINKKISPLAYAHAKRDLKMLNKELEKIEMQESQRERAQSSENLFGKETLLNFEDLNVDAFLIDEFHRYKRLGFTTSLNNIKGIDTAKSNRSQSMLLKMRWIQQNNKSNNTHGYTGTPISNTMAEAWTMLRYFRPDILENLGITHFDQFAKTFGQVVPSLEQTGGGTFKIQNRFAKFQNLPEFIAAFRAMTDVVLTEDVKEFQEENSIPKLRDGKITQVILPQSPELRDQIAEFRKTLEWYEELEGPEKRQFSYIPLVIFGRAKQASIDLRLLSPANPDIHNSKVNRVIKNALRVYFDTGGVQMLFSDLYQSPEPKEKYLDEDGQVPNPAYGLPRFNLFYDIRDKLIANGIKPSEIAVMTDSKWDNPEKLEKLFEDANAGIVKFLLGSTERLGVGVNAQRKLIAVHHIDAPARPMDFEQRNGRILRPGNENEYVWVFAYGVEKTLDSAAFQRLSTKQKFINQIMKGVNVERITEDPADEAQMTFDEMMACLSDSPYAQQKLLVDNRLRAEKVKKANFYGKMVQVQRQLNNGEEELNRLRRDVEEDNKYAAMTEKFFPAGEIKSVTIGDDTFIDHLSTEVDKYCDMLIEKYKESVTLSSRGFILVNGIKVNLQVDNVETLSYKTKMMFNKPVMFYTVPDIGIYPNRHDVGIKVESNSGFGLMTSLRFKIDDAIERPKYTMNRIRQHELAINELKRNISAEFDETRLEALEKESQELKEKMIADFQKKPEEMLITEDDISF